jgi:DnaJ homolog subfamily A member 2
VKLAQETVQLTFEIEPGMDVGHVISLSEAGEPHPDGDSGDLNIHIVPIAHDFFKREGNNLKATVEISLADALTGFAKKIEHLDGHEVSATRSHPPDAMLLASLVTASKHFTVELIPQISAQWRRT